MGLEMNSKDFPLPHDGSLSLEKLLDSLPNAPAALSIKDSYLYRLVAVKSTDGTWWPFASRLMIGTDEFQISRDENVGAGNVQLISLFASSSNFTTPSSLEV